MNRAVFLDRDGVINELIYYRDMGMVDSPFTVKQFRLLPGSGEAINIINRLNFKAIVVSNEYQNETTISQVRCFLRRDILLLS